MSFASAQVRHLPNGLRVIVDPVPHVETVALGVWVFTGSRFECLERLGISHLLEHMAFKGTKSRNAREIVAEIENVGGYLNAYTSRELTVYHARLLKRDTALAINLLADILQNSTFLEEELAREHDVIVQEIGESEDSPDDRVYDNLQNVAFPDQPLGRPILGTEESVRATGRDDLQNHLNEFYGAETMMLSVSGAVDAEAVFDAAEAAFDGISSAPRVKPTAGEYGGGDLRVEKPLEQVHVAFAVEGISLNDDDLYTAQILNEIYGGGMSSRLFQEVRERRGLCYNIHSFYNAYSDAGLFGFGAGTSARDVAELVPVAIGELEGLATKVGEEDLNRAKAQVTSMILMGLESLHSRCEWVSRYYDRFGEIIQPAQIIERIEAVTPDRVSALANRLLSRGKPSLSAVGPIDHLPDYESLAKRFPQ